jgi:hypothetical protein
MSVNIGLMKPLSCGQIRNITPPNTACSVHPTGGSLGVFRQFACLGVDSIKMALSHPSHQPSPGCYANANRWVLLSKASENTS